jgi:hypothetical protein
MPGGSKIKHTLKLFFFNSGPKFYIYVSSVYGYQQRHFNKKKILDPGACEKTEVQIKNGPQTLEVSKIRGENKKNFEK